MKKLIISLLIAFTVTTAVAAHSVRPLKIGAVSTELGSVNGTLTVQFRYEFKSVATLKGVPPVDLPSVLKLDNNFAFTKLAFVQDEVISVSLEISYPVDNLPFYPQKIKIEQEVTDERGDIFTVDGVVHIYFTPYNTIEIWSDGDFYDLKRNWFTDIEFPRERMVIEKSAIPVSNIPDNFIPTEDWQEIFQYRFVDGLAYAIPMMAAHPDSIPSYDIENPSDTAGKSLNGDGCFLSTKYNGTITGRIVAPIDRDNWMADVTLPLEGLRIELWESLFSGSPFHYHLGSGNTGPDGRFNINVNQCIALEGSHLEIFIKVFSENTSKGIKAYNKYELFVEKEVTSTHNWYPQSDSYTFNDVVYDKDSYRAINYATKAWRFLDEQLGSSPNIPLMIRTDIDGAGFFIPNVYCGIIWTDLIPSLQVLTLTRPGIFLDKNDGNHENTIYHEFGHFTMWWLQSLC